MKIYVPFGCIFCLFARFAIFFGANEHVEFNVGNRGNRFDLFVYLRPRFLSPKKPNVFDVVILSALLFL